MVQGSGVKGQVCVRGGGGHRGRSRPRNGVDERQFPSRFEPRETEKRQTSAPLLGRFLTQIQNNAKERPTLPNGHTL